MTTDSLAMRPRVLVASDHSDLRARLRSSLATGDFDTYVLSRAFGAFEFACLGAPDVAIFAFQSSEVNRSLCAAISRRGDLAHLRTVVMDEYTATLYGLPRSPIDCDVILRASARRWEVCNCVWRLIRCDASTPRVLAHEPQAS